MANKNLLNLIKEGVEVWNKYRIEHPEMDPDLTNFGLAGYRFKFNQATIDLKDAVLCGANLSGVNLNLVDLHRTDFTGANLNGANLSSSSLCNAQLWATKLMGANLTDADLSEAELSEANLTEVDLTGANLNGAILDRANLNKAKLSGTRLFSAELIDAKLRGADLNGAHLGRANLSGADLRKADLRNADLSGTDLTRANLSGADLGGANLQYATLVETNINQVNLSNCKIYGLSVWGLKGKPKEQSRLVITPGNEAEITVDDLQVAQFIYLLLNNKNVRNVIDTITSKAVLILGRFTPERKEVLDLVREELHKHNYVPILFDFENTENQPLLQTLMTLAGMARFVIADVTAATMVREELRSIVEKYPAKPIQPILLQGEKEYVTLPEMSKDYKNILKTFIYQDKEDVVSGLSVKIIKPAETWLKARKYQLLNDGKTQREMEMEKEIEALKKRLQERHS